MDNQPHVYLFTDGSCTGTGIGAWAALVLIPGKLVFPLVGVESYTTINRCELQPSISGLRWIKKNISKNQNGVRVAIICDSQTTVQVMGGLNQPSSNLDLWSSYQHAIVGLKVYPHWRERNSHPYMEYVDTLCSSVRRLQVDTFKYITEVELPANDINMENLI